MGKYPFLLAWAVLVFVCVPLMGDDGGKGKKPDPVKDNHANFLAGKPEPEDEHKTEDVPEKLDKLSAKQMTPREFCGLNRAMEDIVGDKKIQEKSCGLGNAFFMCRQLETLMSRGDQKQIDDAKVELMRNLPHLLHSFYDCVDKLHEFQLNKGLNSIFDTLKEKGKLLAQTCETFGDIMTEGHDPDASAEEERDAGGDPTIDFNNPCGALFRKHKARVKACFNSASDTCKVGAAQIEIENLVPTQGYAIASSIVGNISQNQWVKGLLKGAFQVAGNTIAEKVNDYVLKGIVKKAGYVGAVAMAAITASAKQIYMAAATGGNDWGTCVGMGNLGACFRDKLGGGLPGSEPLAVAVNGQIQCCVCDEVAYKRNGIVSYFDTAIGKKRSINPVETGDFTKTLCYQKQGTPREVYLVETENREKIYTVSKNCQRMTLQANSCLPPSDNKPITVTKGFNPLSPTGKIKPDEVVSPADNFDKIFEPRSTSSTPTTGEPVAPRSNGYSNPTTGPQSLTNLFRGQTIPAPPQDFPLTSGVFKGADGKIYAAKDRNKYLSDPTSRRIEDVRRYNPNTQQWEDLTSPPQTPLSKPNYANPPTGHLSLANIFRGMNVPAAPPGMANPNGGAFVTSTGLIYYARDLKNYLWEPSARKFEDLFCWDAASQNWVPFDHFVTPTDPTQKSQAVFGTNIAWDNSMSRYPNIAMSLDGRVYTWDITKNPRTIITSQLPPGTPPVDYMQIPLSFLSQPVWR